MLTKATGTRRSVLVVVHETLEEMRRVAAITIPMKPGYYDDAMALCQVLDIDTDRRDIIPIVLRFARGHHHTELVAHECTHAASELVWADCMADHSRASRVLSAGYEPLAQTVGELTQFVIHELFLRDLFD